LRIGVLLAVALLVTTACGGAGEDEDAGGRTGELSYVRSGGLAGAHDRLTIQPDGSAELVVRGHDAEEFSLSDDELDALVGTLDGARLGDLPEDSTSEPPAPDAFLYEISYGPEQVRTDDPSAPSELRPLLTELDRIVGDHRPQ
jgi:hypothetical protein